MTLRSSTSTARTPTQSDLDFLTHFGIEASPTKSITISSIYVEVKVTAAAVTLSATQQQWYFLMEGPTPHVSLTSAHSWKSLGQWVKSCKERTDWIAVEARRWVINDSLVQKYHAASKTQVQQQICDGPSTDMAPDHVDDLPPWLGDIPSYL